MKGKGIRHKLWGKLKKQAHDYYKIVPEEHSENYALAFKSRNTENYIPFVNDITLEKAMQRIEVLRERLFTEICYEALYERRKKKVSIL